MDNESILAVLTKGRRIEAAIVLKILKTSITSQTWPVNYSNLSLNIGTQIYICTYMYAYIYISP